MNEKKYFKTEFCNSYPAGDEKPFKCYNYPWNTGLIKLMKSLNSNQFTLLI